MVKFTLQEVKEVGAESHWGIMENEVHEGITENLIRALFLQWFSSQIKPGDGVTDHRVLQLDCFDLDVGAEFELSLKFTGFVEPSDYKEME